MATTPAAEPTRRTKRRFAHELFPHPEEGESRPLEVEVPYRLASAIGCELDREWNELMDEGGEAARAAVDRTVQYIETTRLALLTVALHEGKTGQDAWDFAFDGVEADVMGELLWEKAVQYGVDPDQIRPYFIRAEAKTHEHWSDRNARGSKTLLELRVPCPESECERCTEPVPATGEGESL